MRGKDAYIPYDLIDKLIEKQKADREKRDLMPR
jgi:hypothetical protein